MGARLISTEEVFEGEKVRLRLLNLDDCTEQYLSWLQDPLVNQFLETRWEIQTLEKIRDFAASTLLSDTNYLFAILDRTDGMHVGNIKLGPINLYHAYSELSYFIGERSRWGLGLATDSIRIVTRIAIEKLNLDRLQAGVYQSNLSSCRALIKAGYQKEAVFKKKLKRDLGREDHLYYCYANPYFSN